MKAWHLNPLKRRHHPAAVLALFGCVSGGLAIGLLACMAHLAQSPLVFPSLGPTAFLLFYQPLAPSASPRNAVCGHLIGASVGWLSLLAFGLTKAPAPGMQEVTWARMGAAALSIGLTIGLMELWDVPHAPAGATTMIVSLGLMSKLWQLGILMAAVIALIALGWAINHLVGVPYPLWRPLPGTSRAKHPG